MYDIDGWCMENVGHCRDLSMTGEWVVFLILAAPFILILFGVWRKNK